MDGEERSERIGSEKLLRRSAAIITAYVSNNAVSLSDLPQLIVDVHTKLARLAAHEIARPVSALRPAVPIENAVTPDYVVCLEDGKRFRSMRRHLATAHAMTPERYRERWRLPSDFPIIAPSYAANRSAMAKAVGLGQIRSRVQDLDTDEADVR